MGFPQEGHAPISVLFFVLFFNFPDGVEGKRGGGSSSAKTPQLLQITGEQRALVVSSASDGETAAPVSPRSRLRSLS